MLLAKCLLTDRHRPFQEGSARGIIRERASPVRGKPIEEIAHAHFRAARAVTRSCDQIERERVKAPRPWPCGRVVVNSPRVNSRHCVNEDSPRGFGAFTPKPTRCHRAHQSMQANRLGYDRRIVLVGDHFAINERERP
jgi:hypothetical protein